MSFLDFVARDYDAVEHARDYGSEEHSSPSPPAEHSIFTQAASLIRGDYVLGTACGILITAGLSKGVSVIFKAAGALFEPDLFMGAMIVGELAAQIICDLGGRSYRDIVASFLSRHAIQFVVAIPTTFLTYTVLALATAAPLALGSVTLASLVSFLAYRIMVVASVAVFSTIFVAVLSP